MANILFLHNIILLRGTEHEAVIRNRKLEPETTELATQLVDTQALDHNDLRTVLTPLWPRFVSAATRRAQRLGRPR